LDTGRRTAGRFLARVKPPGTREADISVGFFVRALREISCRITANDMQILHSARRAEQNAMFREWERLVAWVVGASLLMVNVI
jgi:hypothetical protein